MKTTNAAKKPPVPEWHTRCPHCGHDQKRGSWSVAHLNVDQTATCEACSQKYDVQGSRTFSTRGRLGRKP